MNLGQLAHVIRARYLVDAIAVQPGPRPAVHGRRAGDHARGRGQEWLSPMRRSKLTAKDFKTDQEVRWCPGCGDYAILAAVQSFMPELSIPREQHRLRLRHRLLVPLPVLHEHLRHALDPRPRAGDRDRPVGRPAPTCRCGWSPATATRCRSAATT